MNFCEIVRLSLSLAHFPPPSLSHSLTLSPSRTLALFCAAVSLNIPRTYYWQSVARERWPIVHHHIWNQRREKKTWINIHIHTHATLGAQRQYLLLYCGILLERNGWWWRKYRHSHGLCNVLSYYIFILLLLLLLRSVCVAIRRFSHAHQFSITTTLRSCLMHGRFFGCSVHSHAIYKSFSFFFYFCFLFALFSSCSFFSLSFAYR